MGFSLYHGVAMILETLPMFYSSEEKEVGMEHTPDKWIAGRRNNEKA